VTEASQAVRQTNGRWRRGVSGNPKGRPRGSKNRRPRRRADPERAAEWTGHDWRVFYGRAFQEAQGMPDEKHGAALAECTALWLLLNPPRQRPGLCAQCGKTLNPPLSSVNGAPIRFDGAWVHWSCQPWFSRARWDAGQGRAGAARNQGRRITLFGKWAGVLSRLLKPALITTRQPCYSLALACFCHG
jgi:hypothetical protein